MHSPIDRSGELNGRRSESHRRANLANGGDSLICYYYQNRHIRYNRGFVFLEMTFEWMGFIDWAPIVHLPRAIRRLPPGRGRFVSTIWRRSLIGPERTQPQVGTGPGSVL
jgi:hypothetical protein